MGKTFNSNYLAFYQDSTIMKPGKMPEKFGNGEFYLIETPEEFSSSGYDWKVVAQGVTWEAFIDCYGRTNTPIPPPGSVIRTLPSRLDHIIQSTWTGYITSKPLTDEQMDQLTQLAVSRLDG